MCISGISASHQRSGDSLWSIYVSFNASSSSVNYTPSSVVITHGHGEEMEMVPLAVRLERVETLEDSRVEIDARGVRLMLRVPERPSMRQEATADFMSVLEGEDVQSLSPMVQGQLKDALQRVQQQLFPTDRIPQ